MQKQMARRRWKKLLGITLIVIIALVGLGITFTIGWRPLIGAKKRALTDREFEATPQRLARGKKAQEAQTNFFVHSLRLLSFFVARSFFSDPRLFAVIRGLSLD